MPNTCDSLQKSVDWCEGTPVLPGIIKRLYYINKKLIVAWPTLTKNSIGQVTTAKYTGSFTLAENAVWSFIDILPDKSTHTSEPQGEYPSQTQLNKLTVVHPGTGEDASVLASVMNNSNNVFICQTADGIFGESRPCHNQLFVDVVEAFSYTREDRGALAPVHRFLERITTICHNEKFLEG